MSFESSGSLSLTNLLYIFQHWLTKTRRERSLTSLPGHGSFNSFAHSHQRPLIGIEKKRKVIMVKSISNKYLMIHVRNYYTEISIHLHSMDFLLLFRHKLPHLHLMGGFLLNPSSCSTQLGLNQFLQSFVHLHSCRGPFFSSHPHTTISGCGNKTRRAAFKMNNNLPKSFLISFPR